MLQLYQITQQEASQMQCMLDISRSMSKAYADLVANFISSLTNLVLLRKNAYLRHDHPNLDAFRLYNLRSATISGDLFDRTLMQEYEQHLIVFGVKPRSKKDRFHPYKKQKKGRGEHQHTWCNSPFFPTPTRVAAEEVEAFAWNTAVGVTLAVVSSNSLLYDTYQTVLPSRNLGQRPTTVLDNLSDILPSMPLQRGKRL